MDEELQEIIAAMVANKESHDTILAVIDKYKSKKPTIDTTQEISIDQSPVEQPGMVGFEDVNENLNESITKDKKLKELPPMALISSPEFTKFVESETQKKAAIEKELITQAVNDPSMSKALITNNYTVEDVNVLKSLGVENLPEFAEGSTGLVSDQPATNPFTSKGNITPITSYNEAIEKAISENNKIYSTLEESREEKNNEKRFDYISNEVYSENNNLKPEELEEKVLEKMKFNMVETSDARAKSFAGDELYNKWQNSKTEDEKNNVLKEIFDSKNVKGLVDKDGNFVDKTRLSKIEVQEIQGQQQEEIKQLKDLGVDQRFKLYSKDENKLSTIATLLSEKGEDGIFDQSLLVQKGNELLMNTGMSPGKGDKKLSDDFLDLDKMSQTGVAPSDLSFLPQGASPLINDYNKALKELQTIQTAIGLNVDLTKLDRESSSSILGEETEKAFGFSDMTLGINEMQNTLLYAMEDKLGFEAKQKEIETMGLPGDIYVKQPGEDYFSNEKLLAQLPGFAKMSAEIYFSMGILGGAARVAKVTAGVGDLIAINMSRAGMAEKTAKAFGGFSGGVLQESIGLVGSNTIGSNVFGSEKMAVIPFAVGSQISHLGTNWLGKIMPKAIASYATKSPALGNVVNFTNKFSSSTVSGALKFASSPIIGTTAIKAGEFTSGAFDIATGSSDQNMSELWHHITDADSFIETYGALLFMSGAHPNKSMKKLVDNFNSDMVTINKNMAQWNRLANQIGLKAKKTGNWSKKEIYKAVDIKLNEIATNSDLTPEQAREQMAEVKALGKRIGIKRAIDLQKPSNVENWNTTYKNLQLTINSLNKGNKLSSTDVKNLVDAGFANNGSSPILELKTMGFDNVAATNLYKFAQTSYNEAQQFFKDANSKNFKNYIESSINEQTNANIKANLKSQYDNKSLSEAAYNFKNKEVEANIILEQERQTNLIDLAQGDAEVRIKETIEYAEQIKAEGSETKELNNEEFIELKSSLTGKESNSVGYGFQTVIDGKNTFVINKDAMLPNKGEYRYSSGGKDYIIKGFQGSTLKHEVFHPVFENKFSAESVEQRAKKLAGAEGDLDAARETIIKEDIEYIDQFKKRLKDLGVFNRVEQEMKLRPGYNELITKGERSVEIEKEFINEFLELQNEGALNSLVKDIKFKEVSADVITELKNGADVADYFFTGIEQTPEGKAKVKEAQEAYKELVKDGEVTVQTSERDLQSLTKEYKENPNTIELEKVEDLIQQYTASGIDALKRIANTGKRKVPVDTKDPKVRNGIADLLVLEFDSFTRNYDPTKGKPSTYMNLIAERILPKYVEKFKPKETTRIDDLTKEIADTKTPETDLIDKEATIKETERLVSVFEGKEAKAKQKEIIEVFEDLRSNPKKLEEARIKGFGGTPKEQLSKVAELLFNIPDGTKVSNPSKNVLPKIKIVDLKGKKITPKQLDAGKKGIVDAKEFVSLRDYFKDKNNLRRFLNASLPEYNVNTPQSIINVKGENIQVSKDVVGKGIRLPDRIYDYFYEQFIDPTGVMTSPSGRGKGKTSQVQKVYKIKPEFRKPTNEVIDKVSKDILADVKIDDLPSEYNRTIAQLVKGMSLVETMAVSNQAKRTKLPAETAAEKQLIADIKSSSSKLSMSEKIITDAAVKRVKIGEGFKNKIKKQGLEHIEEQLGNKEMIPNIVEKLKGPIAKAFGNILTRRGGLLGSAVWNNSGARVTSAFRDGMPLVGNYEAKIKSEALKNLAKQEIKNPSKSQIKKAEKAVADTEVMRLTRKAIDAGLTMENNVMADLVKQSIINDPKLSNKYTPEQLKKIGLAIDPQRESKLKTNIKKLKDFEEGKELLMDAYKDVLTENPESIDVLTQMIYHKNSNSHPLRNLATYFGTESNISKKPQLKNKPYEEHTLPFGEAMTLMVDVINSPNSDFKGFKKWMHKEYFQEGISAAPNGAKDIYGYSKEILDQPTRTKGKNGEDLPSWASKDQLHPELKKQTDEAKAGKRKWENVISADIRKYNEYKSDRGYINPNKARRVDLNTGEIISDAKRYNVEVDEYLSENPAIIEAQNELIHKQLIGDITAKEAREILDEIIKVKGTKEADRAFKETKTELDGSGVMNTSEKMTTEELVKKARTIDKALRMADRPNMPEKKIRIFDFDDTIAKTKSKVFAEKEGERIELTAEEFAEKGMELIDQGYEMDFTDFNKVVEGKKGPLFDLIKKLKESPGERDLFILTARAPESQAAIFEFMKAMGVDIPLENITGLGKSSGEAKANWVIDKAAEGYNDFYFADDAKSNVKAVKKALDVIDVKSKVQQARLNTSEKMNTTFNEIIEESTGIDKFKVYSDIKAQVRGAGAKRQKFFIPPSAEDFLGLIYTTLGRGKKGEAHLKFYKDALLDPYTRAMENLSTDRVNLMADFKALKKQLDVPKDLAKKTKSGFTNEQATRVYLWNKMGEKIPGLSKTDLKELNDIIESDPKLKVFADQILSITKGDGYSTPKETWATGTITTDLIDVLNTKKRSKYLETWNENKDVIYSKENLNKLEAAYGSKYREAVENSLVRMKSGSNRISSGIRYENNVLDYINNSAGAIMFFNTRSAILQTLSAANFINWGFNNPLKAGIAFANQPQYWKDFGKLINSDYLKDRRNGLKLNISESEIADAAKNNKNKAKAVINYILEKGYLPTKFADSFAIAAGGSTFYRNRIKDLIKNEGKTEAEAESIAMKEFRQISETSQQSSDPSKISSQQSSNLGRVVLQFANTPMQYARIQKRAVQDIANGRGDLKTNISKVIYYGFVQNMIFNGLQQAVTSLGFGDDEMTDAEEKKLIKAANGMLDSSLRGLGFAGVTVQVLKNLGINIYDRSKKDRPEYSDSWKKLLEFSPSIKSKLSKFESAAYPFESKKKRAEVFDKGFSLNNPAYESMAKVINGTTNLPLDRLYNKIENLKAASNEETETWEAVAMVLGWSEWQIKGRQNYVESKDVIIDGRLVGQGKRKSQSEGQRKSNDKGRRK